MGSCWGEGGSGEERGQGTEWKERKSEGGRVSRWRRDH